MTTVVRPLLRSYDVKESAVSDSFSAIMDSFEKSFCKVSPIIVRMKFYHLETEVLHCIKMN